MGAISAIGLLGGFLPSLSPGSHSIEFMAPAAAQSSRPPVLNADVSDTEVTNYAKAVLAIEPLRQQAYNDVKQIMGARDVPPITCFRQGSMRQLPETARPIVERYCNRSKEIIEQYFGNTRSNRQRYNDITIAIAKDKDGNVPNPQLQQRIENELIRLQRTAQ